MSRSDWRKFGKTIGLTSAAFFILALLYVVGFYAGNASGFYEGPAQRAANQYPSDTQRIIDECLKLPTRPATSECISEAHKSSQENQRAEYDLKAQRDMSDWAWWVMVIGALQFFATIATLGFVKLTLDATLEAVKDTGDATKAMHRQNEIAELANRAWLDIDVKIHEVALYSNSCIDFSIIIKNVGNGVAYDVKPFYKWFFNSTFLGEGAQDFFEECSEKASVSFNCVPPGSEQEIRMQFRKQIKTMNGDDFIPQTVWIAVCATYSTNKKSSRWDQVNKAIMIAVKTDDDVIEAITFEDIRHGKIITLPVTPLTQVWYFDKTEDQQSGEYA